MEQKKIMSPQQTSSKKPDESGNVLVQGHIKIFDPQTKEILINKRA